MRQGRNGVKILGLSLLAALSLMAISASAAQASGHFLIEGIGPITANATVEGTVGAGELLVEPFGLKIACTSGTIKGEIKPGGLAQAEILYNKCIVPTNKFCKVYESAADMTGKVNVEHIKATGTGELGLHKINATESTHYLKVTGLPTKIGENTVNLFSTIYMNLATDGCTLPLENFVTGSTVFLLPTALSDLINQTLNTVDLTEEKLLLGSNSLLYGNEAAHLTGGSITDLHLTGANAGKKWGAL